MSIGIDIVVTLVLAILSTFGVVLWFIFKHIWISVEELKKNSVTRKEHSHAIQEVKQDSRDDHIDLKGHVLRLEEKIDDIRNNLGCGDK
jgi:flagellar basal body-associated protein FliL